MLLGRHKEAEAALLESLGGLRAAPAPPANHIRRTIEYLRDLYLATGQEAKSAEYQAMLAEQRMLDH
jgi:hypothetical protein